MHAPDSRIHLNAKAASALTRLAIALEQARQEELSADEAETEPEPVQCAPEQLTKEQYA